MYNAVVSNKCIMWKGRHSPSLCRYWKKILFANDRNRVRGAVLGLSQDETCTNLFENFIEHRLKRDLSNDTTVNPPLFSQCFKAGQGRIVQETHRLRDTSSMGRVVQGLFVQGHTGRGRDNITPQKVRVRLYICRCAPVSSHNKERSVRHVSNKLTNAGVNLIISGQVF
jgi:hypothetical protein